MKVNIIFVAPSRFLATWSASSFGVCTGARVSFSSDWDSGAGVTCFFFGFSAGAVFFGRFGAGFAGSALPSLWSKCSLSPDNRADRLFLCGAEYSGSGAASDFFLRAGGGLAGSSGIGSGSGWTFVVRLDVRRVN